MKKGLIALIILLTSCAIPSAYSQSLEYVGIKGGISIPNLTSGSAGSNIWNKNYASRIGPNLGILATFQFSDLFSIQPEITYIGEGGKRNGIQPFTIPDEYLTLFQETFHTDKDYVFADFKNVSRLNYIQIPIQAQFNFPLNADRRLKFFIQAGPYFSFLVAAKQIIHSDNLKVYLDQEGMRQISPELVAAAFGTTLDTTVNAKDEIHKGNIGIQGSVGFSYAIRGGNIFIEGGGNYGFLNIQKGDAHGKNHIGAGTVAVGYALKLP